MMRRFYCHFLSFLSWLKDRPPYTSGHDLMEREDSDLECRRCHEVFHWFVPAVGGGLVCTKCRTIQV